MEKKKFAPYTLELGKIICDRLAEGETVIEICKDDPSMPDCRTVYGWAFSIPEFKTIYFEARRLQSHKYCDDVVALAKDPRNRESRDHMMANRLEIDTKKWITTKVYPRFDRLRGKSATENLNALLDDVANGIVTLNTAEAIAKIIQVKATLGDMDDVRRGLLAIEESLKRAQEHQSQIT